MKTVEIYTRWWCGYCRMARSLLDKQGIVFEEIDVTFDREKEAEMINRSGRRTVPQIFIQDEAIGGYTELAQLSVTTNLRDLIASGGEHHS